MSAAAAASTGSKTRTPQLKVLWSHEDFVKVARDLVQRYPASKFDQAASLSDLSALGRVQLETAMQEALPAHLHKRIKEAWRFKPGILRALRSLKEHAPIENNAHIVWTDEEWKQFAVLLQALHPTENFMRSADLKDLKTIHLNTASSAMPLPRQRIFVQVQKSTVARLLGCYRAVLTENQRNIERQSALTHATPAAPAPLAAAAAPHSATVTALPAPKARSKTKNGAERRLRIFWTDPEWLAVAEELVRQNPKDDFLADVLMKGLTARKVEQAQESALPAERWRHLVGLEHLRSRLRMALNKLHRRAAEQEAEPEAAPQEMAQDAPPPQPAALEPAPPAGSFELAFQQACRPLAELMAREVGQIVAQALLPQLLPQLVSGLSGPLAEALGALLPAPAPAARALPFINPPQPAGDKREVFIPPKADKPAAPAAAKLPVVGVVGPLPAQQRVLEAAYPQLKLLFVEKDNRGDVCKILRSCVRVVGMTSFMTHSIDGALKRHFQHRYGRVTGGVSAIKHQLDIWLKSGVLNERYADMLAN